MIIKPRILIVDDEHYMAESLKILLINQGYHAATAESGYEAKKLVDKEPFDVVLLDVLLPDLNGQEVMDHAKARAPETIVIFLTGHTSFDPAIKAFKSGGYDYIRKPFALDELFHTIQNALQQKQLKEE